MPLTTDNSIIIDLFPHSFTTIKLDPKEPGKDVPLLNFADMIRINDALKTLLGIVIPGNRSPVIFLTQGVFSEGLPALRDRLRSVVRYKPSTSNVKKFNPHLSSQEARGSISKGSGIATSEGQLFRQSVANRPQRGGYTGSNRGGSRRGGGYQQQYTQPSQQYAQPQYQQQRQYAQPSGNRPAYTGAPPRQYSGTTTNKAPTVQAQATYQPVQQNRQARQYIPK